MKTRSNRALIGLFFFFQTVFCSAAMAQGGLEPIKIPSPITRIFVPDGFDSNDNVEVVLQGYFDSTCYKVGNSTANVNGGVIEIEAFSYKYQGPDCQKVRVSFVQSVRVGPLSPNNYSVKYKFNNVVKAAPLNIVQTLRSEPDDFLYAPVSSADLVLDEQSGAYKIRVEGYFPNFLFGCMVMQEVRSYLSPGNVIIVQPIAKMYKEGECHGGPETHHFKVDSKLDFEITDFEYLIHARVLNGNSYNQYIDHIH